ncbi:Damage-regulated import facilitator 1 [Lachancea thermotolerans]|uniref:Damage-regulated import facilitator 1 n=1 Tax=Lachancea thermotolerans (strain ATCC 56472 / CBS 6340 / NRRL Y-8284) TaxID=559295 RepID=DIF1_LACTC|nr:KLTH0D16016p [Lachancea thermotolerans CBS 6340]C5DFL1.1 RecName: Full=Damage-regulated import facilitator 1 [Lachancea thermotolerans CBS 6340]CAR22966.1 KLTH0D16016p [Lachancea thermotolerans CBS 6340]
MTESPQKRHLGQGIERQNEQYACQGALSTIGMRIRQSVDRGYQVSGAAPAPAARTAASCVQDNSELTIPDYKRVPMPSSKQAPMLVNSRTVSSSSSLEMWENQLDERLEHIDNDIMRNKRAFEQVEDW